MTITGFGWRSVSRTLRGLAALACVTFLLTGCGGGGGGDSEGGGPGGPPPPTPSAEDLSNAQNAQLRMTQSATSLSIKWRDTFANELGYRVERRVSSSGDWTLLETVPATDGGSVTWKRSLQEIGSGTYRVSASLPGYSLPLYAAPNESEVAIDATTAVDFAFHAGTSTGLPLRVSVTNSAPAQSVDYYVGGVLIANVTSGADFTLLFPMERALTLPLPLVAEVHKSTALTIRVERADFGTRNTSPAMLLHVGPARSVANTLALTAMTSSSPGIVSVEFFANGHSLQVLHSPDRYNKWVLPLDPATLPSGLNTFRAVATDATGHTASMDAEYTLDAVPSLAVEGVFDGMILEGGNLDLQGTFGDNVAGSVLSVELDDNNILLKTRTSPFNLDHALAGATGEHTVTLRAESPDGKVSTLSYTVFVPSTTLPHELVATDAARLLAVDQGTLLYEKNSGAVVLRDAAGVETELQLPPETYFQRWWLSAGKVIAQERISRHLHVLDTSGTHLILTALGAGLPIGSDVRVKGDWVSWGTTDYSFSVYNLTSGAIKNIAPANTTIQGLSQDLDTTPGSERLLFCGIVDGTTGIYSYGLATDAIDLLVTTAGPYSSVRTDNTRFAWSNIADIKIAPLSDPSESTTLAELASSSFQMEDGLIFWNENDGTKLLVNDGSSTVTLVDDGGVSLGSDAVKDGRIVFADASQLHTWDSASGEQTLFDTVVPALHSQDVAYLLTGSTGALYRTTLP